MSTGFAQRKVLTEETRLAVEERLAEGWPVSECIKSGMLSKQMAARHFKGRGWTPQQSGTYSQQIQRAGIRI